MMRREGGTDVSHGEADCGVCRILQTCDADDRIAERDHFVVTAGMDVPGWCLVSARRHEAQGLWSLSAAEATELGPVLAAVAGALRDVCGAERTYLMALGENVLHFHAMVMARSADVPSGHRGPSLISRAPELSDRIASRVVAGRLRERMAAMPRE